MAHALPLSSAVSLPCSAVYETSAAMGRGALDAAQVRSPAPPDSRGVETPWTGDKQGRVDCSAASGRPLLCLRPALRQRPVLHLRSDRSSATRVAGGADTRC